MTKAQASQSAFDAIQFANEFHLTEKEKSHLYDWVFQTAPRDTKNDKHGWPLWSTTAMGSFQVHKDEEGSMRSRNFTHRFGAFVVLCGLVVVTGSACAKPTFHRLMRSLAGRDMMNVTESGLVCPFEGVLVHDGAVRQKESSALSSCIHLVLSRSARLAFRSLEISGYRWLIAGSDEGPVCGNFIDPHVT